jgi:hypothetical protein
MASGSSKFDQAMIALIAKLRLVRRLIVELTALLVVLTGLISVVLSTLSGR